MSDVMLNLVVIRCEDVERAVEFYGRLGLEFVRHRHGTGPEHWTAEAGGVVFELYPAKEGGESTLGTRLGFRVGSVDAAVAGLTEVYPETVVKAPEESEWGRRAVVRDLEGHRLELVELVEVVEVGKAEARRWLVMRQDDHGRRFVMGAFGEEEGARALLAEFAWKEHKQDYWIEEAAG